MAEKKDKLMKEFLAKPIQVGDEVRVPIQLFRDYETAKRNVQVTIMKVNDDDTYQVQLTEAGMGYGKPEVIIIGTKDICKRDTFYIGANPFPQKQWWGKLKTTQFQLESILYRCGYEKNRRYKTNFGEMDVDEVNFNPYVIDKDGNKKYYQRDFVWTLEDKQLLIESIYNGINCGKVVVRDRGYNYVINELNKGNKEVAMRDIVDGKQRVGALLEFVNDMFCDLHGNYFTDLSNKAQNSFFNSDVITWAELGEEATDEDVIETFLMVNFTGKIMSREHIDYVKEISKTM